MEKSIKGTRTEQNLLKAFAGESQARSRYVFFASKAKKEGYEQIAGVFAETAEQEKEHAALKELEETLGVLLLLLGSLGEDTRDLLVTLLLRLAREEDVTAARLALTGKRLQQILFSPCSFNALFHNPVCLMCVFIFR